MKKLIAATVLSLALIGCSGGGNQGSTSTPMPDKTTMATPAPDATTAATPDADATPMDEESPAAMDGETPAPDATGTPEAEDSGEG